MPPPAKSFILTSLKQQKQSKTPFAGPISAASALQQDGSHPGVKGDFGSRSAVPPI